MAGIFAFKDAMQKANPILLAYHEVEHLTNTKVNHGRPQCRAKLGMETRGNVCVIDANVPLENMFDILQT